MKARLTLQEKLRDLRNEKGLTLKDVEAGTGISDSTLQRIESNEDMRVGYQDIAQLAKFYQVTSDYLLGLTDNREYQSEQIGRLGLTDNAVVVLKDKGVNKRLISELLSHPIFPQMLRYMEIYVDKKVQPQIDLLNYILQFAQNTINEHHDILNSDYEMSQIQQSQVDQEDYLLFRVREHFGMILADIYKAHETEVALPEQPESVTSIVKGMEIFTASGDDYQQGKRNVVRYIGQDLFGFHLSHLSDDDIDKIMERPANKSRLNKRVEIE